MRSKGPPPQAYSQLPVPGPDHPGGGFPPDDPGLPASRDRPALPPGLPLRSGNAPQTVEAMEVIQEETQMMMAMKPQTLIKTCIVGIIENHSMIQIRVAMMEVEDVEADPRLLLRSTNGQNRYLSWISLP